MANEFYIGKRLSYDSRLCTVRYVGDLQGTKGTWLGVEWDDPSRGKHSGEHQGVKYFSCLSTSRTAASFVRPTRKLDPPHSFVEALRSKYASDSDSLDSNGNTLYESLDQESHAHDNVKSLSSRVNQPIKFSGKVAEEIGFDKIRKQLAQLEELRIIILDGLRMWRPEARMLDPQTGNGLKTAWEEGLTDIKDTCPKVMELDLSRNLFEEWREVAAICEQLDQLKSLRVDGTRFRDTRLTETEQERCRRAFARITSLKLEENLLPWEDLARLTHLFPDITTFSASSNFYTTLTSHNLNPSITNLTLEDNMITSLSALEPLTHLPKLQRLILKSNKISAISTSAARPLTFSTALTEVDLSFNEISTWTLIEALQQVFPGLASLRVSHNPLFESLQTPDGRPLTADDGYMLTLARLGRLKMLNHSPISEKERLNAESYYLSLIAKEIQSAPENSRTQVLRNHPRYAWLCEEYGEPVVNHTTTAVNPNSLAARLLRVNFVLSPDAAQISVLKDQPSVIEIPMSCSAYTAMGIAGKTFGIKPGKCRLIWETGGWMPAKGNVADPEDDDWDSGDESGSTRGKVAREVEIIPGTRTIGTWVDGTEATIRVEVK